MVFLRTYLKWTLLVAGSCTVALSIVVITAGTVVKQKFDDDPHPFLWANENVVEASQYWAGIPIFLTGILTIITCFKMDFFWLNVVNKVTLLVSLVLCLAVLITEEGDRSYIYMSELVICHDNASDSKCKLFQSIRHWYSALLYSTACIFGFCLMALFTIFANLMRLGKNISGNSSDFMPMRSGETQVSQTSLVQD